MCIATERDGQAPFLGPPLRNPRPQPASIHLQDEPTVGKGAHRRPKALLETSRIERSFRDTRPRTDRVVDVTEHLELIGSGDHPGNLLEECPDHVVGRPHPEQGVGFVAVVTDLEGVKRTIDPIEGGHVDQHRCLPPEQMGLAEIDSDEDRQVGKPMTASLGALAVAGHVQWRWSQVPVGVEHAFVDGTSGPRVWCAMHRRSRSVR